MNNIECRQKFLYQSPQVSIKELFLEGFLCSSDPLAAYVDMEPWIEESYNEDIVLIQDR